MQLKMCKEKLSNSHVCLIFYLPMRKNYFDTLLINKLKIHRACDFDFYSNFIISILTKYKINRCH